MGRNWAPRDQLLNQGPRWEQVSCSTRGLAEDASACHNQGPRWEQVSCSTRGLAQDASVCPSHSPSPPSSSPTTSPSNRCTRGRCSRCKGRRVQQLLQQQGLRSLHPMVLDLVPQQRAADSICDSIGVLCPTHGGAPDAWRWSTWYVPVAPYPPRRHLRH